jgi:hypothetical protein
MQRFMQRPKRILLGVALAALFLTSAGVGRAESLVYQRLLRSTGLVEVPDREGSVAYGTCWVVDRPHGLALTARHVAGDATEAVVYFPAYRDGAVIPELVHYHHQVAAVRARVIHRDVPRDLALLRLDALPDEVAEIPLAAHGAGPGDEVHSVGNSGVTTGTLWRYTAGRVRSVYQGEVLHEDGLLKARIVETQSPINPGDSGGPLVNDGGELVGVVLSTERETHLVSFNVDVSEVRAFLGEALGTKVQQTTGAPGTDRQPPPVQGSWKVVLIDREGEQLPGECRFEADGTFTLTARGEAGPRTRRGRYNYANGVLLMAWDRLQVRKALHWVHDRRFTFLADEMLIFDRQPDAEPAPVSSLPRGPATEHSLQPIEKTSGSRPSTGDQPLANGLREPAPNIPVHAGEEPSMNRLRAAILLGALCVFLVLAISAGRHRKPTSRRMSSDAFLPGMWQRRA